MTTLRQIMRRHAAGVAVITARDDSGAPVGLTVSSFTPVSLDPPLVGFCLGNRASVQPALLGSTGFAVNVLGGDQADLATRFATHGVDRFAGLDWAAGPGGWPRLPGALSWLACTTVGRQPAGDHVFVLGHVDDAEAGPAGIPLVHHGGELIALRPGLAVAA
jgi:flavin reductase (DIM6/NTAB) family NADH-FMN oxidoreductase RutF